MFLFFVPTNGWDDVKSNMKEGDNEENRLSNAVKEFLNCTEVR